MDINLPLMAGTISTTIFALSTVPMLLKAFRTRDLRSYSLGNMLLANTGNVIHSVYVFHLPAGPIWLLHSFYLLTTALISSGICAISGAHEFGSCPELRTRLWRVEERLDRETKDAHDH